MSWFLRQGFLSFTVLSGDAHLMPSTISYRRAMIARSVVRLALTSPSCNIPQQSRSIITLNNPRILIIGKTFYSRVVSFEDVKKGIEHPNKVIIDVREPDEVNSTGKIPSSINIPLGHIENVLTSMSEKDFKKYYQRNKPQPATEMIFYCRSGRRASEAVNTALKLGYSNSKTYMGSWEEWSNKTQGK